MTSVAQEPLQGCLDMSDIRSVEKAEVKSEAIVTPDEGCYSYDMPAAIFLGFWEKKIDVCMYNPANLSHPAIRSNSILRSQLCAALCNFNFQAPTAGICTMTKPAEKRSPLRKY